MSLHLFSKSSSLISLFFKPGQIGRLLFTASSLAISLLPIEIIDSGVGPIQVIPKSMIFFANWSFSARKPYPG